MLSVTNRLKWWHSVKKMTFKEPLVKYTHMIKMFSLYFISFILWLFHFLLRGCVKRIYENAIPAVCSASVLSCDNAQTAPQGEEREGQYRLTSEEQRHRIYKCLRIEKWRESGREGEREREREREREKERERKRERERESLCVCVWWGGGVSVCPSLCVFFFFFISICDCGWMLG